MERAGSGVGAPHGPRGGLGLLSLRDPGSPAGLGAEEGLV